MIAVVTDAIMTNPRAPRTAQTTYSSLLDIFIYNTVKATFFAVIGSCWVSEGGGDVVQAFN